MKCVIYEIRIKVKKKLQGKITAGGGCARTHMHMFHMFLSPCVGKGTIFSAKWLKNVPEGC
jgi:hypothetical protein